MENKSVFEQLFEINVNEHVRKKKRTSVLAVGVCMGGG